jgi:hypothetical protein
VIRCCRVEWNVAGRRDQIDTLYMSSYILDA